MIRRLMVVTMLFLAAGGALAAEVAGVKLDDRIALDGRELILNGAGVRTRLIFKVYVASLYLPSRATDLAGVLSEVPRRLQMNMLRSLSADQLVGALNEGLKENNSEAEMAAIKTEVGQLAAIMHSFQEVKENDTIALDYAGGVTRIVLNGQVKESIAGEAFNRALMKIWLGEHPVQRDLKQAMLGK